ncbi:hypothetical protein EsH8_XI_000115 [Colletotrichum jinshuiense]
MDLLGFDGPLGPLQFYKSSKVTIALTILASNGINILPSYNETLKLTTATKSLNAAASFLGWAIVATFMGPVVDRVGRRTGVLISIFLKIIGVVFMTVAQNVAMFVVGRMILGAGSGTSSIASSSWLAETLPTKYRASGLSFIFTIYYVGNNIVSYYLGDMLTKAGINNSQTQLQINIILSAWCLVIACIGTYLMNVAVLYPPEVLNYSIRSNGMAAWTFAITCGGLFSVFVWPFALAAIGWKTYMINAGWDAVQFAFVAYFWIETKGLTLEEINAKFDALHETDRNGTEGLNGSGMILEGVAKTTSIDAASSVKLQKDGIKAASQSL